MQRNTSTALIRAHNSTFRAGSIRPCGPLKSERRPHLFSGAQGAYLSDVDGNEYIDYIGSWGPMILGHNFAPTVEAVTEQAQKALSFGAPTEIKVNSLKKSSAAFQAWNACAWSTPEQRRPCQPFDWLKVYKPGYDLKSPGCYHGHSDSLLVKASSGVLTLGLPNSPVCLRTLRNTL